MKILALCSNCADEGILDMRDLYSYINYNDDVSLYTCPNGHKNYYKIINNKYELLYDSAIISYNDGYYRETIMNLFSCLENFYEYVIRLLLYALKNETIEQIEKFIKNIKSRSECREGCFLAMCKIYLDKEYFISDEYKSLRNQVIHNGLFPSEEKTKTAAQYVFEFICECYNNIKDIIGSKKVIDFNIKLEQYLNKKHNISYKAQIITTMLMNGCSGSYFEKELQIFKNETSYDKEIMKFLINENIVEVK